ncbi:hypothetical protein ACIBIZ_02310 [Nonomuraea spiralis]|uniref:hypothetical protein n=1 Tax=Nonomuraea TaxID=83681 RepID=UPI00163BEE34|nr:hypothetical protein [Nonomuraea sp. WAC 01424]
MVAVVTKPHKRGIGDIPIRAIYLAGAILATVVAVLLVFVVFSGDVPTGGDPAGAPVSVAPVPAASATPTASPTPTETPIVLPPVPESKAFATPAGSKASVVTGIITDRTSGISYPRLAAPWDAKSFAPFTVAQRIGKVAVPHTVIASAMFPGDAPEKKPSKDADYREMAARAARWTLRTQYPAGATLTSWTGSKKVPLGKGWSLGYKVTFVSGGKTQTAQAMVTIVEVGKTKPAMLMASIPEKNKARWADLNTLVQQVKPL